MWGCGRAPVPFRSRPPLGLEAEPSLWRRGPGGGAGRRGRHEGSGLRHVLRVPHARRVAPAPHVLPTTLVTTFPAAPPVAPQRGAGDPGGLETLAAVRPDPAPGPRSREPGHVRSPAPAPCAPGSPPRNIVT
eukprot:XP_028343690.1 E3 ubiquitin-protein ligase TRIM33-like [Physeter catodon]